MLILKILGWVVSILALLCLGWCLIIRPCRSRKYRMQRFLSSRFAHRGLHDSEAGIPENSVYAFRRAIDSGYGAELDVHLTKDGRLAVMHDSSLMRMCGVERKIEDATAEELADYCLEGTEEQIPYLEQVLGMFKGQQPLIIELKVENKNYAQLAEAVCDMLSTYAGAFIVESFDPRALLWLKKNRPFILRGQLAGYLVRHGEKLNPFLDFMLRNLLTSFITKPDFIAFDVRDRGERSMTLCRKLYSVPEFAWTVNDVQQAAEVEADGGAIIFEHILP